MVWSLMQLSGFQDIIEYLERNTLGVCYMISRGDNGSTGEVLSSSQTAKVNSTPNTVTSLEAFTSDFTGSTNASENPLARSLSDELLDVETFLSTLDIGGQNLARSAALPSQNDLSEASFERAIPVVDLKLRLHLYKVLLLLLTRNLKATKCEVKLAMNIARGADPLHCFCSPT